LRLSLVPIVLGLLIAVPLGAAVQRTAALRRITTLTASIIFTMVYVASLAVLQAERGQPDAHITDFGQAVWWAITTITTVGYGDMYPVTTTGRVIAALLMIGGISLVGSITATIASWIVQSVADDDAATAAATAAHINELRAEIASLREELRRAPAIEGSTGAP
ncbi:potassium channel family protein, partial [Mycolicibacterium porcinum]|uniref:potassium channel family protein n=1 Tax=Mycolicibacterium porcinum TaxID=39693 RepID=UPI000AA39531